MSTRIRQRIITLAIAIVIAVWIVPEAPVVARAAATPHAALRSKPTAGAFALRRGTLVDTLNAIRWGARRWGASFVRLLRVATCESGLNPWASNGVDLGLFQFLPSTYYAYGERIGEFRSIWSAWGQADVAAYMFARVPGGWTQWTCRQ